MTIRSTSVNNDKGVYAIVNTFNGKFYVGSSKRMIYRIFDHLQMLESINHHTVKLQRDWWDMGPEAFEFHILVEVPQDVDIYSVEQAFIDYLKPEYNMSLNARAPSMLGRKHSAHTRAKISRTKRKK